MKDFDKYKHYLQDNEDAMHIRAIEHAEKLEKEKQQKKDNKNGNSI